MPFSLADQLRLLGSSTFEELCAQLVKGTYPDAHHVHGAGGDEGIDIFSGPITPGIVPQSLRIWQVKFFRDGVRSTQRKKVEESLSRALQHRPKEWILCIPVDLTIDEHRWFEALKTRNPGVSIGLWQANDLVTKLLEVPAYIDRYFLAPQPQSPESLERVLNRLSDYVLLKPVLENLRVNHIEVLQRSEYYLGVLPTWADIASGLDAPRAVFEQAWDEVIRFEKDDTKRLKLINIVGQPGSGKTTVLMRAGIELVRSGQAFVYFHKEDSVALSAEQVLETPADQTAFVLIDQITRFDQPQLRGFFERLRRANGKFIVISTALQSLWAHAASGIEHILEAVVISANHLIDEDIELIISRWEQSPKSQRLIRALDEVPNQNRLEVFRSAAQGQILQAIYRAGRTASLDAYLHNEFSELSRRLGHSFHGAVLTVSLLDRFEIVTPRTLLELMFPNRQISHTLINAGGGLVRPVGATGLRMRNGLLAEVLLSSITSPRELLVEIIAHADSSHERLLGRLLGLFSRTAPWNDIHPILALARERFPEFVVFKHIEAVAALRAGKLDLGRVLLRSLAAAEPENVPVLNVWGLEEARAGNLGAKEDPAPFTARWLFRRALQADAENVQSLNAWGIEEARAGNLGAEEDPAQFTARWLFRRALEVDPENVRSLNAWGIEEARAGNLGAKEDSAQFTARWLFRRALQIDPENVQSLNAWGIEEARAGNLGTKEDPAPFTARWLFRRALQVDPAHVQSLNAWGIEEARAGNLGAKEDPAPFTARWLFRRALQVDPAHVQSLNAWGIEEARAVNLGAKEDPAPFTARWLFRRALQVNPAHVQSLNAWGIEEARAGNLGAKEDPAPFTARWLFRRALQVDPENVQSLNAWGNEEARAGNLGAKEDPAQFTARWLFRRALQVNPEDVPVLTAWANVERGEGDWEEVERLLMKAADVGAATHSLARIYYDIGYSFSRQRNETKAIEYYRKSLACDDRDPIAHAKLARAYGFMNEWEKSEKHYLASLAINPDDQRTLQWYESMCRARARYANQNFTSGRLSDRRDG